MSLRTPADDLRLIPIAACFERFRTEVTNKDSRATWRFIGILCPLLHGQELCARDNLIYHRITNDMLCQFHNTCWNTSNGHGSVNGSECFAAFLIICYYFGPWKHVFTWKCFYLGYKMSACVCVQYASLECHCKVNILIFVLIDSLYYCRQIVLKAIGCRLCNCIPCLIWSFRRTPSALSGESLTHPSLLWHRLPSSHQEAHRYGSNDHLLG